MPTCRVDDFINSHAATVSRVDAGILLRRVCKMVNILILAGVIVAITSAAEDSMQLTSYRKSRKATNGPEMCALDTANKTISPSSLQDCSLDCATDLTCTGFNIKDSHTCDIYTYNPKTIMLVSSCVFYQVAILVSIKSYFKSQHHGSMQNRKSNLYGAERDIGNSIGVSICPSICLSHSGIVSTDYASSIFFRCLVSIFFL